ncbi:MAG: diacylglycerol/lipid kinase family protein [Acidimicrobiales bacterium]
MTRVALVANPAAGAGTGATAVHCAERELRALGATVRTVAGSSAAATAAALRELIDAAAVDRAIVLGGDGIVHLAVQVLAEGSIPLGICPVGSGNDIAAAMSIPPDLDEALRTALGPTRSIDLLRIGDHWAASIATIGFAGDVNACANRLRRPRGASRYTVATIVELPRLQARPVQLSIDDGAPSAIQATLVAVANTDRFGGGMRIAPDAAPDDGLLDITVVGPVGRLRLLRFFGRVFRGTHTTLAEVTTYRGGRVALSCPGVQLWADGEPVGGPFGSEPVSIEIVRNALVVAAPSPPTGK